MESADIVELVTALIEPDAFGGVPAVTEDALPCPGCQTDTWVLHGPRARIVDDVLWTCASCGVGTVWALSRRVLESPVALERFLVQVLASEGAG
ncbi:MAG: hypothetical protein M3O23_00960 [Actinomycetota bacterium]|nr:hypothetical protein [Actinomycetota bacterium]